MHGAKLQTVAVLVLGNINKNFTNISVPNLYKHMSYIGVILDGFGGLVVSILATGTRVRGFKPT
jgi:hypothetical protein